MKALAAILILTISGFLFADVSGKRVETFGRDWNRRLFSMWLSEPDALITPEVSRLAVQACLRDSQKNLDLKAYAIDQRLLAQLSSDFGKEDAAAGQTYRRAFGRLAQLLSTLDTLEAKSPGEYSAKCQKAVASQFRDTRFRDEIEVLYEGRLNPRLSASLPAEWRKKLEEKFSHGLHPAPLTWNDLVKQICVLEGYYGTSPRKELWKFFSTTRAMANVLPAEDEENLFTAEVARSPIAINLIGQLNRYAAIAGRYNGPSVGMTGEEMAGTGVRLTGPALGSHATALMALFTTPWREGIQQFVLNQDYPEKAFQLLPAAKVLSLLRETPEERLAKKDLSQTEAAMLEIGDGLFPRALNPGVEMEVGLGDYATTASLAWLALNAETNLRQNEKITGYKFSALHPTTTHLYGTSEAYDGLVREIDLAVVAYRNIDPRGEALPGCLAGLRNMNVAAAKALGPKPSVAQLSAGDVAVLDSLHFQPVIADIGLEVDDNSGEKPAGLFRLHLATGYGRELPVSVQGKSYRVWTPSAMVLHLNDVVTTAAWQAGEVAKYDSRR